MQAPNPSGLANPLTAWAASGVTTAEMLTASAFVIGQRLARLYTTGAVPSARDQREFTLMGQEKLEAAASSWQAMIHKLLLISPQVSLHAYQQMISAMTTVVSLSSSRTPEQAFVRQAKAVSAIGEMTRSASRLTDAVAAVVQAGLEPIHAKATANAKRLAKG